MKKIVILTLLLTFVNTALANSDVELSVRVGDANIAKKLFEQGVRGEDKTFKQSVLGLVGELVYESSTRVEEGRSFNCYKLVKQNGKSHVLAALGAPNSGSFFCDVQVKF